MNTNFRKSLWPAMIFLSAIILSACNLGAAPAPTQDPGAIQTQSFSIVLTQSAMQITQTALAIPPSPIPTDTPPPLNTPATFPTFGSANGFETITPFAFNTQQPGFTTITTPAATLGIISTTTTKNGCNDGQYQGETPPYDKSVIKAGKEFSKGWMILNTGTCKWDEGYRFKFQTDLSSPELKGYDIVLLKDRPEEFTKPGSSQTFIVKLTAPAKPGEYKGFWKLRDDLGNYFGPLVSVWIVVQ